MEKKIIVPIIVILLVVSVLGYIFREDLGFTILPIAKVDFELEDGIKPVWVIPISIDSSGIDANVWTTYNLYPAKFEEGQKDDKNYEVTETIQIKMRKEDWFCKWGLQERCLFKVPIIGYCIGRTYEATPQVQRFSNARFQIYKGGQLMADKVLDPYDLHLTQNLNDNGKIRIKGMGMTQWRQTCEPMNVNVKIIAGKEDDEVKVIDQACIDQASRTNKLLTILIGMVPGGPGIAAVYNFWVGQPECFYQPFYADYESVKIEGGQLVAVPKYDLGNTNFVIYADADYIGKVTVTPVKNVEPEIVNIVCPPQLSPGSQGGVIIEVENKEKGTSGNVFVKSTVTGLFNVIPSTTPSVGITDTRMFDFTISYPIGGENDKDITVSFTPYSSNEMGTYTGATKSCTITAKKQGSIVPPYCPNGKCESWETHSSCPDDCDEEIDCDDIPGSVLAGSKCICPSGTNPKYVNDKLTSCDETSYLIPILIGLGILAIIITLIAVLGKKQTGGF